MGLLNESRSKELEGLRDVSKELHNAIVGLLALTPCKLFILSQEDLLKDVNQQNMPGTTHEYPNWSLKMKYSVEELRNRLEAKGFAKMFRQWIQKTGRGRARQGEEDV
jgi:4-alpha-glucanotransferase